MDADKLLTLGFTITAGQIDRGNVNYGCLIESGVALTPEGEALALSLDAPPVEAVSAVVSTVVIKRPRKKADDGSDRL